MSDGAEIVRSAVDRENLPPHFPTNRHQPEFWESLGRAVATFGLLEEVLGKAIFSFTATREISPDKLEAEYSAWLPTLSRALSDPLGGLIGSYKKAVKAHHASTIVNLDVLIDDLRQAAVTRNVICHGSWRPPDAQGRSLPLFVNRDMEIFQTPIDVEFLRATQAHVVDLVCSVMDTVTRMGWQFPGSNSPGEPMMRRSAG